jgi:hypothetical protein
MFVLEMILKLFAFGFKRFFKDAFNSFDSVLVLLSIIDIVLSYFQSSSIAGFVSSFKTFRLLRIFKLAK